MPSWKGFGFRGRNLGIFPQGKRYQKPFWIAVARLLHNLGLSCPQVRGQKKQLNRLGLWRDNSLQESPLAEMGQRKKGPNIERETKIMKMEEIKQVVKSRYGKFAETGPAKQESC